MSKINIGDEIAFRNEYSDETETGYVKGIERSMFWKTYLVEDNERKQHIITSDSYYIMPTGRKSLHEKEKE